MNTPHDIQHTIDGVDLVLADDGTFIVLQQPDPTYGRAMTDFNAEKTHALLTFFHLPHVVAYIERQEAQRQQDEAV